MGGKVHKTSEEQAEGSKATCITFSLKLWSATYLCSWLHLQCSQGCRSRWNFPLC